MLLLALGVVTMLASRAWAGESGGNGGGKGKPPGNNGTVKIDGDPLKSGKGNEPHVSCDFNVEFYNFDKGDDFNATVTFALQAPTLRDDGKGKATKDGQVLRTDEVFIGEDPAGGGGDLDASERYSLSFVGVQAHPKQGYHVKLTVNAPGSQGADVKHKVFWVDCKETTPPTTPPPTTPPATTGVTPTTAPTTVLPARTTPTTAPTQVLGIQETRPALPRTGPETEVLVFLAGLALALGGLTLLGANATRQQAPVL